MLVLSAVKFAREGRGRVGLKLNSDSSVHKRFDTRAVDNDNKTAV